MKYLKYYSDKGITKDAVFDYLLSTLKPSIVTWAYFTDFNKVKKNITKIELQLAILNTLIGKPDTNSELIKIVKEYPKVRAAFPILIALRREKLKKMRIITDLEKFESQTMQDLFDPDVSLTKDIEKRLIDFFYLSGLKSFFESKNVKSIVDYVYGVEVGLDTNGRKNRTGKIMESIVEQLLNKQFSNKTSFIIHKQVSSSAINKEFGLSINFGREEKGKERRIDFVIYDKKTEHIYALETNAYMGGGSKPKSTAGEYITLNNMINSQPKVSFIWITDGPGWHTTKAPLKETFQNIDYIFNLKMIEEGILSEIIK